MRNLSYKKAFWGVLLILAGILFILKNLGYLFFSWKDILHLWPVIFVLWGISVLPIKEYIKLALSLVVIALLFGYIQSPQFDKERSVRWHWEWNNEDRGRSYSDQTFEEPFDEDVVAATLHFDAGAGEFRFEGNTDELISVKTRGLASYSMTSSDETDGRLIRLNMTDIVSGEPDNKADVRLHSDPEWSLNIDCGAADLRMDLSAYKVTDLDIDAGAADINVKLGDRVPEARVKIDAGASDVDLHIPESSGCEIRVSSVLTDRNFEDFERVRKGLYRTPGFDSTDIHVLIDIDVAVADLKVKRY